MEEFDVVVVGAGVIGSATAYQLLKHGASKVLLLEQVINDPRAKTRYYKPS